MNQDHLNDPWRPWQIRCPLSEKQLSQGLLKQIIWNIEFPLIMAGAGSICIGSPLLLGTGIIHLTNNLIHLFASGFHFRWWFWGLNSFGLVAFF